MSEQEKILNNEIWRYLRNERGCTEEFVQSCAKAVEKGFPANNHLIIELDGDFNYSITDARGRVVMEGLGNNKTTVDVQSFEYGVYFVNIHANDKSSTIRIVKQ